MYTKLKTYKENILVPRNLESRQEKLRQDALKFLGKETIDGDFELEPYMLSIPEELINVKIINGDFTVHYTCGLTKMPEWFSRLEIYGSFYCDNNRLLTLENCPAYIENNFNVSYNTLDSLKCCPETINGGFYVQSNSLKSLEYGPTKVARDYNCSNNNINTLKGAPELIEGDFNCSNNYLYDLKFLPKQIDGLLNCSNNMTKFTEKDFGNSTVHSFAN